MTPEPDTHNAAAGQAAAAVSPQLAVVEPAPHEWDTFVRQHPAGNLLQCSSWGSLKAAFGWEAQRIAVVNTATSPASLAAGAQLLLRGRLGVNAAYVPRGPLFADDPAIDHVLLATLRHVARRRRAVFLRLEPNLLEADEQSSPLHTRLLLRDFQPTTPIQPRSSIHIDLTPEPEHIFAALSKGHRADIRRAERQGVTVRVGSARDINLFYAIMQQTGQRADFGIHSAAYYRLAWELFYPASCLLLAEYEEQIVAGHLVFADGHCGFYLYSGATDTGLKRGANHLLQWRAMQWARARGCTRYDMWGIPDALGQAATAPDDQQREALTSAAQADPLIGVYRFKKGFGGQIVRYLPAYDQVYIPALYTLWQHRFA